MRPLVLVTTPEPQPRTSKVRVLKVVDHANVDDLENDTESDSDSGSVGDHLKRRKMKRVRIVHRDGTPAAVPGDNSHGTSGSGGGLVRATARKRARTRQLSGENDNLAESSSDIVVRTRFPERRAGVPAPSSLHERRSSFSEARSSLLLSRDSPQFSSQNAFRARRNYPFSNNSSISSQNIGEIYFTL